MTSAIRILDIRPGTEVRLTPLGGVADQVHVFEATTIDAVNAALAAGRPLLVRGEPGIGKSQLARGAAKCLERAYIQYVVDARTESRDLLWHFDAIERLAEAQLCGALKEDPEAVRERLRVEKYLRPGPLWWAFDWKDAEKQAGLAGGSPPPQRDGGKPGNGCIVLVDEIDKAETDVPNGLLEALGGRTVHPLRPIGSDHRRRRAATRGDHYQRRTGFAGCLYTPVPRPLPGPSRRHRQPGQLPRRARPRAFPVR